MGFLPRILFPLLSVMSRQISCACIICNIHNHQEIKGVSTYLLCSKKEKNMPVFFYSRETHAAGEKTLTSKPLITLNKSWCQHWRSLMGWQLWAGGARAGVGGRGDWFPSRISSPFVQSGVCTLPHCCNTAVLGHATSKSSFSHWEISYFCSAKGLWQMLLMKKIMSFHPVAARWVWASSCSPALPKFVSFWSTSPDRTGTSMKNICTKELFLVGKVLTAEYDRRDPECGVSCCCLRSRYCSWCAKSKQQVLKCGQQNMISEELATHLVLNSFLLRTAKLH